VFTGNGQRIILIYLLVSKAVDNEFSGNMIDVCPVGALTDKTFKSRVWFSKPYNAHRVALLVLEKLQFGCLVTKFSVLLEEKMSTMK
jgi:hypothetical protein